MPLLRRPTAAPFVVIEPLEPRRLLAVAGLNAVYFDNSDFSGTAVVKTDPSIAFTWNGGAPTGGISATTFSVRWNGLIKPYTDETYTFLTKNNDGVRLWVNGKLLIDGWYSQPTTTRTATIGLKANRLYDLRVEHFADSGGSNTMQLSWDTASRTTSLVPQSRLSAYDTRGANVGDFGYDSAKEYDVSQMIKKWSPDYVTTVGDNNQLDGGGWSQYDRVVGKYYQRYIGSYRGAYGSGAGSTNKFFPAMGNHDWDDGLASVHKDYYTLSNNERYYDVRKGSIHFFIVSSDPREPDGRSSSSKQAQWIKAKMLGSNAPFKVVIFHHPPYSSSSSYSSTMRWPFKDWGADLVLSGHQHSYERLSVSGIPYVVNGAGGTTVSFGSTDSHSVVRNNSDVGALLISANEYAMTVQYQQRSGKVIDTITLAPSPGATPTAQKADAAVVARPSSSAPANPFDQFSMNTPLVGPLPAWSTTPIGALADDASADAIAI